MRSAVRASGLQLRHSIRVSSKLLPFASICFHQQYLFVRIVRIRKIVRQNISRECDKLYGTSKVFDRNEFLVRILKESESGNRSFWLQEQLFRPLKKIETYGLFQQLFEF